MNTDQQTPSGPPPMILAPDDMWPPSPSLEDIAPTIHRDDEDVPPAGAAE